MEQLRGLGSRLQQNKADWVLDLIVRRLGVDIRPGDTGGEVTPFWAERRSRRRRCGLGDGRGGAVLHRTTVKEMPLWTGVAVHGELRVTWDAALDQTTAKEAPLWTNGGVAVSRCSARGQAGELGG